MIVWNETTWPQHDWLWHHFQQWVIPALRVVKRLERRQPTLGWGSSTSFASKRIPVEVLNNAAVRPLRAARVPGVPREIGLLLAAKRSMHIDCDDPVPFWNRVQRYSQPKGWRYDINEESVRGAHNAMRRLRTHMREHNRTRLFLPGRDAWTWAVLAAARGWKWTFVPGMSRVALRHQRSPQMLIKRFRTTLRHSLVFDTGFAGTITRKLEAACPGTPWMMMSTNHDGRQIFPTLAGSRHAALHIEYQPKYWRSGYTIDPHLRMHQQLETTVNIMRAAVLTAAVYYGAYKPTEGVRMKAITN